MLGYFDKVSDCSARTLIIKMKTIGIAKVDPYNLNFNRS
jgi:hypothetical protein